MNPKKIEKFIHKQKVSFICSIDDENYPNVRAMLKPRKHLGLREFYFSTNTSSAKVQQYRNNPNASIYFYHKGLIKYTGVMLKGKMKSLNRPNHQRSNLAHWRHNILQKGQNRPRLLCTKIYCHQRKILPKFTNPKL